MSDLEQEQGKFLIEKRSVSNAVSEKHEELNLMMNAIEGAGRAMQQQSPGSFIITRDGKLAINPKDTGDVLRDWPSSQEIVEFVRELNALEERMTELESKEKDLLQ